MSVYDGLPGDWQMVVGLEVHVELATATKLFSASPNRFGDDPNTNFDPVTLGLPGALPVLNERAVELAMRIGLALNCTVRPCAFHRKNYFYPDMPKAYQVSQYDEPLNVDGWLDLANGVRVGIERAHMEEDAGKSTHIGVSGRVHGADYSLIDLNRAGVPLVEIVSRPDIRSADDARAYVNELRAILVAIDASDAKMEEGSMRVDANVSVHRPGTPYGTRCEIKNVNSVRSIGRAIEYEARRQIDLIEAGEQVQQQTRHWDEADGRTHTLRTKEDADDYRYFPEPDLVPLAPDPSWVERLRAELPELPAVHRARIRNRLGVSAEDMQQMANAGVVDLVATTVEAGAPVTEARNWWLGYLAQKANERDIEPADLPITPAQVARIVELVGAGTLSVGLARQAVDGALDTGEDIDAVVAAKGLRIVSDANALAVAADEAIAANPDIAAKVRSGKVAAVGPLVGAVMKATRGQADAAAVRELLLERLGAGAATGDT